MLNQGISMSLPSLPNIPSVKLNHHIQRYLGSSGIAVSQHGVHEVLQCLRNKFGNIYCYKSFTVSRDSIELCLKTKTLTVFTLLFLCLALTFLMSDTM